MLQPIAIFSKLAVDEANTYLTKGATGRPEKQELKCILVTPQNVGQYRDWSMSSGS